MTLVRGEIDARVIQTYHEGSLSVSDTGQLERTTPTSGGHQLPGAAPVPPHTRWTTSTRPGLTTIGFSFAGTCFSAISIKRVYGSGRNLDTRGLSTPPTFLQYTLITKKKIRVLPLASNVEPAAGSVQTMQFLRKGYGCQP